MSFLHLHILTDKKLAAVVAVAPIVVSEAMKGGTAALVKDAETFAGLVIEEVVGSLKQTPVVLIGEAVLHALGLGGTKPAALPTEKHQV